MAFLWAELLDGKFAMLAPLKGCFVSTGSAFHLTQSALVCVLPFNDSCNTVPKTLAAHSAFVGLGIS